MTKPALTVVVETHKPDGTTDSLKSIDWNNSSDRKWLVNHMHWALHNSRQVTITPESL